MLFGDPSFWFQSAGPAPRRPPLAGPLDVDVAIVGAGFTGLWTAYHLRRADPALRIVVLEREAVGHGASGRNGGWLCPSLAGHHDPASRRAASEAVADVGRVIAAEGIDCDHLAAGGLIVAVGAVQETRLRDHLDELRAGGTSEHDARWLDAGALAGRVRVEGARAGVWERGYARVQPAKLARGLADAVERLGVVIHEDTEVRALESRLARTAAGDVRARWVVRATEAYSPGLPGLRRSILPLRSTMVVTEPLPDDVWAQIGWDGCEPVADMAKHGVYCQRTADGRIALGGRGVPYHFRSRADRHGEVTADEAEALARRLWELWPAAAGVPVAHAWGGVFGVHRDWRMAVTADPDTGLASAGGYVGVGVAASNLAGRILADLLLGRDSALTRLPVVRRQPARSWEPEPFRFVASRAMDGLYTTIDRREAATGRPALARVASVADRLVGSRHY